MQVQQQYSANPPAQPTYILRGHTAAIHSVCFLRENGRLLTGDADGWVVLWDVAIKRAAAVWKAHEGAILGLKAWGADKIVTHGRDNKLNGWQVDSTSEASLSKTLPVDNPSAHRTQPWLLHSLAVNTLNFCSFTMCSADPVHEPQRHTNNSGSSKDAYQSVYVAVPGVKDDHVDIFQLPSEVRLWTVSPPSQAITSPLKKASPGMVMALSLHVTPSHLLLAAGYEAGTTHLFALAHTNTPSLPISAPSNLQQKWQTLYSSTAHTQPILSLCLAPSLSCYFTSSADSIIARHPLPSSISSPASTSRSPFRVYPPPPPFKTVQTKHSGQQSLTLRSDAKIFATAGWDARIRVYSAKTMTELAVLKWHKEGCYCVCFAEVLDDFNTAGVGGSMGPEGSLISGVEEGNRTETEEAREGGEPQGGPQAEPEHHPLLSAGPRRTTASRMASTKTVRQKRDRRARSTHWLAAGSKDGKVSLWEIY